MKYPQMYLAIWFLGLSHLSLSLCCFWNFHSHNSQNPEVQHDDSQEGDCQSVDHLSGINLQNFLPTQEPLFGNALQLNAAQCRARCLTEMRAHSPSAIACRMYMHNTLTNECWLYPHRYVHKSSSQGTWTMSGGRTIMKQSVSGQQFVCLPNEALKVSRNLIQSSAKRINLTFLPGQRLADVNKLTRSTTSTYNDCMLVCLRGNIGQNVNDVNTICVAFHWQLSTGECETFATRVYDVNNQIDDTFEDDFIATKVKYEF